MGFALLELVLIVFAVLVLLGFITQIAIPFVRNEPFFPQFRNTTPMKEKVVAAQKELVEVTEYVHLKEDLDEINRRKAELEGK
jgi:Na+-transporting methylmalonyl-CoA/oxaloacetate decarboxylase gamma subunit